MGYDLSGGLHLNSWSWAYCLTLARAFGWKPEGTEAPQLVLTEADEKEARRTIVLPEWNGTYFTNDFQKVRGSDAAKLSLAI